MTDKDKREIKAGYAVGKLITDLLIDFDFDFDEVRSYIEEGLRVYEEAKISEQLKQLVDELS